MEELNDLVDLAKKYHSAQENVKDRFMLWVEDAYPVVKSTLENIKEELYGQVLFMQPSLEVEEHLETIEVSGSQLINYKRKSISLNLASSLVETYSDSEEKPVLDIIEVGFKIFFSPLRNGRIQVYAQGHHIDGEPEIFLIDLKNNPLDLDEKEVTRLVALAVKTVMASSFLFEGNDQIASKQ